MGGHNRVRQSGRRTKKIVGLGESSAHWYIATLAVETGISPRELMELDERMLWTLGRYLVWRGQHQAPKI
jgi:hypothetical protein